VVVVRQTRVLLVHTTVVGIETTLYLFENQIKRCSDVCGGLGKHMLEDGWAMQRLKLDGFALVWLALCVAGLELDGA
jgi:hypothetical protein